MAAKQEDKRNVLKGRFANLNSADTETGESPLENSLDTLLGIGSKSSVEEVVMLQASQLYPFGYYDEKRKVLHRYKPYTKDEMAAFAQDIKQNGILQPLIVRQRKLEEYEILAGHNRKEGAVLAGLDVIPCFVRDVDDDMAIIIMNTTNLNQRGELLPSQRAYGYKDQMDAMKRQGKRTDLSEATGKKRTDEIIGELVGENRMTIQRYIRLTYLTPGLMEMVDNGTLPIGTAENISHLHKEVQNNIEEMMATGGLSLTMAQSAELKDNL